MWKKPPTRAGMLTLCLMVLLTTGCESGRGTEFCLISQPIFISRADQMTADTKRAILGHNEAWERLCK